MSTVGCGPGKNIRTAGSPHSQTMVKDTRILGRLNTREGKGNPRIRQTICLNFPNELYPARYSAAVSPVAKIGRFGRPPNWEIGKAFPQSTRYTQARTHRFETACRYRCIGKTGTQSARRVKHRGACMPSGSNLAGPGNLIAIFRVPPAELCETVHEYSTRRTASNPVQALFGDWALIDGVCPCVFWRYPSFASLFLTTSAIAADQGLLAPGKPAGVKKAQDESQNALLYVGLAAVGIGIALAVSDNSSGPTNVVPGPTTTTTTTSTG